MKALIEKPVILALAVDDGIACPAVCQYHIGIVGGGITIHGYHIEGVIHYRRDCLL